MHFLIPVTRPLSCAPPWRRRCGMDPCCSGYPLCTLRLWLSCTCLHRPLSSLRCWSLEGIAPWLVLTRTISIGIGRTSVVVQAGLVGLAGDMFDPRSASNYMKHAGNSVVALIHVVLTRLPIVSYHLTVRTADAEWHVPCFRLPVGRDLVLWLRRYC